MIDSNVARRYARALLALTGSDRAAEDAAEQLTVVAEGIANSEAASLLTPGAPRAQQAALVAALTPKVGKEVGHLLGLLVERNRFDGLPAIAQSFAALVDARLGRVRATVTSALPMTKVALKQVGTQLTAATGKELTLEAKVDPSLLGGLTADVGGVLYDGSMRTQLEKLRAAMKSNA